MMNSVQKTGETLSAFVDDEMAEDEIDALLSALENPACRAEMRRYSMFGCEAAPACTATDLSERVASCIREESACQTPSSLIHQLGQTIRRWSALLSMPAALVPLSGAVAASLVVVVVLGLGGADPAQELPIGKPQLVAAPTQASTPPTLLANTTAAQPAQLPVTESNAERELVIAAPSQDRMLERLYMQHAKFRGGYALTTPVNYARVGSTLANAPPRNDGQSDSR